MATTLGWLALIIAAVSATLWSRFTRDLRLEGSRPLFLFSMSVAALLGIASLMQGPSVVGGIAATVGSLLGVLFVSILGLPAEMKRKKATVEVGDPMLAFQAADDDGKLFDSSSLAATPYVLKLFRGHW